MKLSKCNIKLDTEGKELVEHASAMFPISFYDDNLQADNVPWHWHDDFEMLVITEGSVLVKTSVQEYILEEGDGCFINSGVLHTVLPSLTPNAKLHSIVFHPKLIGGTLDHVIWNKYIQPIIDNTSMDSVIFHSSKEWNHEVIHGIDFIWNALYQETFGYEILIRNKLSNIFLMLNTHCPGKLATISERSLRNTNRIKVMLEYIKQNYMEEINVVDLADCANISESECLRCFKEIIGIPPIQYVIEFRIQKATELLTKTKMKIVEIGFSCGFQDMSYFSKTFRTIKGCTPSQYRKQKS